LTARTIKIFFFLMLHVDLVRVSLAIGKTKCPYIPGTAS
jgi:hypothetical protein